MELAEAGTTISADVPGHLAKREFLRGYSIEVMPRSAAAAGSLREILPAGTRVYVAHIEGTPIDDMVQTASRIREEGFPVMPHVPARLVPSREALEEWLRRYREEAEVDEALLVAGGIFTPRGPFHSSMDILETGIADRLGFRRLHVAGHPEGNRDIEPSGGNTRLDAALRWKQDFSERTDARIEIATQFCFDADAVLKWAADLSKAGITLPIHVGLAGPAKLSTLLRFAAMCGVGTSLRVLKRRARGATALLRTQAPDALIEALSGPVATGGAPNLAGVHLFPFGGIRATADWADGVLAEFA